jgi:hypothetical protein
MPWYTAALQMWNSVPAMPSLFTTVSCVAKDGAREEDGDLGGDARRGDERALRRRTLSETQPNALASSDGMSMNRSPEGRIGSFVLHDKLSSSASSPGKRVNGSAC